MKSDACGCNRREISRQSLTVKLQKILARGKKKFRGASCMFSLLKTAQLESCRNLIERYRISKLRNCTKVSRKTELRKFGRWQSWLILNFDWAIIKHLNNEPLCRLHHAKLVLISFWKFRVQSFMTIWKLIEFTKLVRNVGLFKTSKLSTIPELFRTLKF